MTALFSRLIENMHTELLESPSYEIQVVVVKPGFVMTGFVGLFQL